ncbi:putative member of the p24 [Candidozyma auris]|uniref:GOLD domain-containing protein n=1 Tax=Candidozyma auris TaxID=498019 RepID=A0A2H1A2V4_CANAR|nr:hypothetical_protein [[Candida] auris]KNE00512.2 hypothetical protein QG37_02544 [[Candida] auris]PIS57214.1 hypothetical protein CJI97_000244 [[Candida] auris]PIS58790.1 hypothetical protein B9J08_000243 [[Candida] auris]PSK78542.1 hypothetical protein CJJ07_001640 [[Candida] auris]QEL60121.1 hypothetical protein CJJ09_002215 [[Candida] auris]
MNVVLTCLLLVASQVAALHFYLPTGQTRCFYEDLSARALVVGKLEAFEYAENVNDYFKTNNLRLQITVEETFDNNHRVVDQKSSPSGDFTFTSFDAGEHRFCLTPTYTDGTSGKWHRIFFDVAIGAAEDYADSKSSHKVDALTLQIKQLNEKLREINFEQESIREREAEFRNQSESTNSRVVWWSIIQLFVLVGTCAYQLRHLKSFFVKQKIV